ncbi:hypothetical protein [Rhodopseudomonas sp. RCAM05734]|uniref:hypothetical protein n=1 Tax=Rhodopseudomonas sp. RCAM05734 TaxID=3457549 RepID=UPI0040440C02
MIAAQDYWGYPNAQLGDDVRLDGFASNNRFFGTRQRPNGFGKPALPGADGIDRSCPLHRSRIVFI